MKRFTSVLSTICVLTLLAACASSNERPVQVEAIRNVSGQDNLAGQIIGNIAPGSKFAALQIGMMRQEVEMRVGRPSELGAQTTGSTWIPYYFGSDTWRTENYYKGEGRLVFNADSRLVLIDVSENARK